MGNKETRLDMALDRLTAERMEVWMATHSVSCREEAIHRLLNYALDSAGIVREPKTSTAA
jgi:hypothetical protein